MKKMLGISALAWLLATLGGCAVYTPGAAVVVDPGTVVVPADRGHFCPPGHAKKGEC